MCTANSLGIVGFGQFGQLAQTLAPDTLSVRVYDPNLVQGESQDGFETVSLETAAQSDIVMICVPVQAMQSVIAQIAPHVRPGSWVLDVASVKSLPAQWMAEQFGPDVALTATHPLFGPQSAKRGLAGQKLAICPIRGDREGDLISYAETLGLTTVLTDPETHDREMAYVQGLTHLIGRSLVGTGLPNVALRTESYGHLAELCELIRYDSLELFEAIQFYNPHAKQASRTLLEEMQALLAKADQD